MPCITENENFSAVCANPAVIMTAFSQYLENEGSIDDEPLNKYVYNMYLFMITLLCNKYFFEHENDVTKLFWTPQGYFFTLYIGLSL